jgi:hypothetical protein
MVDDDVEHNDVSQKELPVQCAHDSDEVNTVDKATDVNGDPSKDSDHTIDAENMSVDEPDCIFDSVKVNTVGEANDVNGHPSQESDVRIDAENSNNDEPDIIHDSSEFIDVNAEQTVSMVDDDVEQNDVSQTIIQGLQKVKEYAQVEGVLAKLRVASELVADLSHGNGVPEMAE